MKWMRWRLVRLMRKVSPMLAVYNAQMKRAGVERHERKRRLKSLVTGDTTLSDAMLDGMV